MADEKAPDTRIQELESKIKELEARVKKAGAENKVLKGQIKDAKAENDELQAQQKRDAVTIADFESKVEAIHAKETALKKRFAFDGPHDPVSKYD